MIKALIFDFDGLIIDTETIWFECFQEVMASEYGHALSMEDYSSCIGTSNDVLYDFLRTAVPHIKEESMEKLTSSRYQQKSTNLAIRPGVQNYMETAKAKGLKIGLASSSGHDWVTGYLKQLGLYGYFDTIVTREEVEKVKPDPALYVKALSNLNVLGEETIAFEDSIHGSHAALAAGIKCVVVPNQVTSHMEFTNYHMRLTSMEEKDLSTLIMELEEMG